MVEHKHVGFVDNYADGDISGWSYSAGVTEQKVLLKINGELARIIKAEKYRPDVAAAGVASDKCGFSFSVNLKNLSEGEYLLTLQDAHTEALLKNGILIASSGKLSLCQDFSTVNLSTLRVGEYVSTMEICNSQVEEKEFSELFWKKTSNLSTNSFIAMCYLVILGRVPDPQGFSDKIRNLGGSVEYKKNLILNMLRTEEFEKKSSIADAKLRLEKM